MSAAAVGAICGVVLTLAALMLLNGTLRLNNATDINDLETQVNDIVASVQAEQSGLNRNVGALDEPTTTLVAVDSETAATLANTLKELGIVEDDLAGVTTEIEALQETAVELDERLATVFVSAENFDAFMKGLRNLLFALQDPPVAEVLTQTIPITTTVPEPSSETTSEPAYTPTPEVTRTPRSTATTKALPNR